MGRAKFGLARFELLLENLKRELNMDGSTLLDAAAYPGVGTINATAASQTVVMTTTTHQPGSLISLIPHTGGDGYTITVTLPAPGAGLSYSFRALNGSGAHVNTIQAPSAVLTGVLACDNGTVDIDGTSIQFKSAKLFEGTQLNFLSDGVNWYVNGVSLGVINDHNLA